MTDLGAMYAASRGRIGELVREADPASLEAPVPATPHWTVHDVVAHLRGIVADAMSGNLEGVATDPWTEAQVVRSRDVDTLALLDEWDTDSETFQQFLSGENETYRAVLDVHTHEADLRGALVRPAPMDEEFGGWAIPLLAGAFVDSAAEAGAPPLRVETAEGDTAGPQDAAAVLKVGRHEFFRAFMGRRSPEQMSAYDWGGADPAPYVAVLPVFGPRDTELFD